MEGTKRPDPDQFLRRLCAAMLDEVSNYLDSYSRNERYASELTPKDIKSFVAIVAETILSTPSDLDDEDLPATRWEISAFRFRELQVNRVCCCCNQCGRWWTITEFDICENRAYCPGCDEGRPVRWLTGVPEPQPIVPEEHPCGRGDDTIARVREWLVANVGHFPGGLSCKDVAIRWDPTGPNLIVEQKGIVDGWMLDVHELRADFDGYMQAVFRMRPKKEQAHES